MGRGDLMIVAVAGYLYKRSTDPLRAQESYDAAQRLFAVARYNQAVVACERAIALKPDFADAYVLRGRSYVAQYDAARGIPDFTRAIELRPSDPQASIERAHAYIDQKNYAAAISDAASALALDPKSARAYNLRGTALRGLGEPQKALEGVFPRRGIRAKFGQLLPARGDLPDSGEPRERHSGFHASHHVGSGQAADLLRARRIRTRPWQNGAGQGGS